LPDITDFCRTYLGIDPAVDPIQVAPTAHYAMGGIPTDVDGRVVIGDWKTIVPGLYAAGECACVSVHGANRLGTNSLLDLVVFGRRAGRHMAEFCKQADLAPLPADAADATRETFDRLFSGEGSETPAQIREELQTVMMDHVGVFREQAGLELAVEKVRELKERYTRIRVQDQSRVFNTDVLEAWELGNLLDVAEVTAVSALNRTESRGAHSREDYPKRNDEEWLKHTLAYRTEDGGVELRYKPVIITKIEPQERVY